MNKNVNKKEKNNVLPFCKIYVNIVYFTAFLAKSI